jgi:hypothetical protein
MDTELSNIQVFIPYTQNPCNAGGMAKFEYERLPIPNPQFKTGSEYGIGGKE